MNSFRSSWLAQREMFDLSSRSTKLAQNFVEAVQANKKNTQNLLRLIDLGGGTGANFRVLAPLIETNQYWLICENDPQLLNEALATTIEWARKQSWTCKNSNGFLLIQAGKSKWTIEMRQIDLSLDINSIDASHFDGVTTSAFLDLVSEEWLQRMVKWINKSQRPFLAAMTVDGLRHWEPELASDLRINEAFQRHQLTDKGFGCALGPEAIQTLIQIFNQYEIYCETAKSDWIINSYATDMLRKLIDETVEVVEQTGRANSLGLRAWHSQRHQYVSQGLARMTVGHMDLLAVPGKLKDLNP